MQRKKNISAPKSMNRDTHSSLLKQTDLTLAINANTENEAGEGVNITNEPSNYKAIVFPEGYKVIGFKYNLPTNKTYIWLTNPQTKKSSVGFIEDKEITQENVDLYNSCTDCKGFNQLGVPLEEVEQIAFNTYTELFSDLECEAELEFDINFPIKSIEIKNEKGQVTAYWDDYKNPSRFAILSDVSYLYTNVIPCGDDDTQESCIFIEKLLHFPNYSIMNIQAEGIQTGGNLKLGTYEFWGTYCDIKGNNIVNYSVPTQPISIFDENNRLLEQTELDSFTNYSIKLTVNNLDTTFPFYKIVCVENTNVAGIKSAFIAGIYPTTDNTVLYSSSGSSSDEYLKNGNVSLKRRIDINELYQQRRTPKYAKGTVSSGNILWKWGLKQKETINLQPVVNLFGSLLKWQSSVAKEELFKSAVACSKYKGYMRNEVQPFGLRFYDLDGNYSAVFPIIGRPSIDDEKEDLVDDNKDSINENTPNCIDQARNKRWQILNTAQVISEFGDDDWDCDTNIEIITTAPAPLQKTFTVENVHVIESGEATIENPGEYTNLITFIEENPNTDIDIISDAIAYEYADECTPNFQDCDIPVLINSYNEIADVETLVDSIIIGEKYVIHNLITGDDFSNVGYEESDKVFIATGDTPKVWTTTELFIKKEIITDFTEKNIDDYRKSVPPGFCPSYETDSTNGKPLRDEEFEDAFMPCEPIFGSTTANDVYFRQTGNITNEDCDYATPIEDNNVPTAPSIAFFHNYSGSLNIAELKLAQDAFSPLIPDPHFTDKLHKGALWFSVDKLGRDRLIFEVTKNTKCTKKDGITRLAADNGNKLRYSVYKSCSDLTPVAGDIFSSDTGVMVSLDCTSLDLGDTFYIAIDAPIIEEEIAETCPATDIRTVYKVVPPCGCYTPYTRDVIYTSLTVSWTNIFLNKNCKYQANCTYQFPKLDNCNPVAYANGEFAYWESTEAYPDNSELYDSSNLKIKEEDLELLTVVDRERFDKFYKTSIDINGNYILKDADFTCQNIRHPKMPDNTKSSFMSKDISNAFAESLIFPLGVAIDSAVVKTILNVAVNNNLITQRQADNIAGYEILRGDNTLHKSIIGNGLGYDLYKYKRDNQEYHYSNYPFNDLGKDVLHYTNSTRTDFVEHPFEGEGNNKFTIISPDLFLNPPTLSTEMVMSGYQMGNSRTTFPEVEKHPKWTILSNKARRTADNLATAEVVLEVALSVSELTKEQWATFGVSSGANYGSYISLGIFAIAKAYSAFMLQSKYRYQWLKTFRDLGAPYNFASYGLSEGFHNVFLPNEEENEYIRGLSLAKYVKDGEYKFVDENTTKTLNFNNYLREHAVLVSTGEYNFNYTPDYIDYDNSTENPSQASRTIASQAGCSPNTENVGNVGSPYFTLKNYIPDQFGRIDSIKWLTTNYSFKLNEDNNCTTVFGGTVSISRFAWKKKIPLFKTTAMGLPDKLTAEYLPYKNIAEPRFYCDYEIDGEKTVLGVPFPDIDSRYNFDCKNTSGFYVKPNSKFYLYYYGITNFLVESEINCNFRYGKRELKNQFFPQVGDIKEWTQQINVPIKEPNTFYYNSAYSQSVSDAPVLFLDNTFSKELSEIQNNQDNAVIYSEADNSQNDPFDSWRVFKPLNWHEFDKKYGKLIALKDLESSQLLARFENGMVLLNAVDSLADRITPQNKDLGTAGIFTTRPVEFGRTDLGYAGTQNTEMASTPYGHFWGDAQRGKVFMLGQGGKPLMPISEVLGDQPTNMKNWFKENLPFKILKDFPEVDVDNKFKGLGLNIWYDSRFDRVFITKRDYIIKDKECLKYEREIGFYTDCDETTITCPEGYTYNEELEICEKLIETEACAEGFIYNTLTNLCEQEQLCENGVDIVFIVDATGSQQDSIDAIVNGISSEIVPAIIEKFGINYRLGLIAVKDRRVTGQALFDILEPMTLTNELSFKSQLETVVAEFGTGTPEPTDMALLATLNNTATIDKDSVSLGGNTIGEFRESVGKAVILITDTYPSGTDDAYTYSDWLRVVDITAQASNQNIQIFSYLTSSTESIPTLPIPPTTPPNDTYIMQYYAEYTGGTYNYNQNGEGLSGAVVDTILADISCPPITTEPACDPGCQQEQEKCNCYDSVAPTITPVKEPKDFDNKQYFEDVSWTIAFKAGEGWNSYFTFYPDYTISKTDLFETGYNWKEREDLSEEFRETLWQHPMNNSSFQVFQGRLHPFLVEYPITNENTNKLLSSISLNIESKRWQNAWDYAQHPEIGFNKAYIWNNTNNSGLLELNEQKTLSQVKDYPKTKNGSQEILFTALEGKHTFNYFYNRIINERNNVPMFTNDKNRIFKEINSEAVSFKGKPILEKLKGEVFNVTLINDKESRFNILLKNSVNDSTVYE